MQESTCKLGLAVQTVGATSVFNYIEMFYNTRRRNGFNNQLSPVEYEAQYEERLASV